MQPAHIKKPRKYSALPALASKVPEDSFMHLVAFDGEPNQSLTCQAVPLSDLLISL